MATAVPAHFPDFVSCLDLVYMPRVPTIHLCLTIESVVLRTFFSFAMHCTTPLVSWIISCKGIIVFVFVTNTAAEDTQELDVSKVIKAWP